MQTGTLNGVFLHFCSLWTHPMQCAHTSASQTCTVDVLYKVPINLSHDSCIRHEHWDCAILTLFFVLLHSLCYKTNILIYNYDPHVFLFSKSVLVREGCLFSLEHFHRKSNFSTCIIEILLSHNRIEKKEAGEFPFLILLEIKASISLSSPQHWHYTVQVFLV